MFGMFFERSFYSGFGGAISTIARHRGKSIWGFPLEFILSLVFSFECTDLSRRRPILLFAGSWHQEKVGGVRVALWRANLSLLQAVGE